MTCSGLVNKHIITQSASQKLKTTFHLNTSESYVVTDLSEYTGVFGTAEERELFGKPAKHDTSLWIAASFLIAVALVLVILNIILWTDETVFFRHIARKLCLFVHTDATAFRVYFDPDSKRNVIEFKTGPLKGTTKPADVVAAEVLFTPAPCYEDYVFLKQYCKQCLK